MGDLRVAPELEHLKPFLASEMTIVVYECGSLNAHEAEVRGGNVVVGQ